MFNTYENDQNKVNSQCSEKQNSKCACQAIISHLQVGQIPQICRKSTFKPIHLNVQVLEISQKTNLRWKVPLKYRMIETRFMD